MSRSRPQSIYVIGNQDGPQKIGITDNLECRLTTLQAGRKARLKVAYCRARLSGDARLVERAAHYILSDKRADGEWFDVSLDDTIAAVTLAIEMIEAGEIPPPALRTAQKNKITGIRFDEVEDAALRRAAKDAVYTHTTLARKIIVDWLRQKGFLPKPEGWVSGDF